MIKSNKSLNDKSVKKDTKEKRMIRKFSLNGFDVNTMPDAKPFSQNYRYVKEGMIKSSSGYLAVLLPFQVTGLYEECLEPLGVLESACPDEKSLEEKLAWLKSYLGRAQGLISKHIPKGEVCGDLQQAKNCLESVERDLEINHVHHIGPVRNLRIYLDYQFGPKQPIIQGDGFVTLNTPGNISHYVFSKGDNWEVNDQGPNEKSILEQINNRQSPVYKGKTLVGITESHGDLAVVDPVEHSFDTKMWWGPPYNSTLRVPEVTVIESGKGTFKCKYKNLQKAKESGYYSDFVIERVS